MKKSKFLFSLSRQKMTKHKNNNHTSLGNVGLLFFFFKSGTINDTLAKHVEIFNKNNKVISLVNIVHWKVQGKILVKTTNKINDKDSNNIHKLFCSLKLKTWQKSKSCEYVLQNNVMKIIYWHSRISEMQSSKGFQSTNQEILKLTNKTIKDYNKIFNH